MSDEAEQWRLIGDRLRQAREYLELKQEEAADAVELVLSVGLEAAQNKLH